MVSKSSSIPRIDLSGTPYEIGYQHGTLLRPQILSQLVIYRTIFKSLSKLEWPQVLDFAKDFQPAIQRLTPHLYREIEGIAAGVGDEASLLDIIALNARSEIALGTLDDGCTSLGWTLEADLSTEAAQTHARRQILAQNWDWTEEVGKNLAMASITQPGKPKIWMVIEPGIVGKIGFNSSSVGVCLNAIRAPVISTEALPIHLLLRIALECDSIGSAIAEFKRLGGAASSQHILIADATSGSRGLEVSPRGNAYIVPDEHGIVVHSNHFLENKFVKEVPWLTGSPGRLERIKELCEQIRAEELELIASEKASRIKPTLLRERMFSDKHGAPQAICCYSPQPDGRTMSTVFNIVMQFAPGKEPVAEVLFGRPGPDNTGPVFSMPW